MLICIFVAGDAVQQLPAVLVDDIGHGEADGQPAQQDHRKAEPVHVKITCLEKLRKISQGSRQTV